MNDCQQYVDWLPYVNLCDYSVTDLIVVAIGTIFWVLSYVIIIRDGFKNKFIEMPLFVAVGNIAWEFIWSFVYKTNMGVVYLWGYRAWFFLDLAILYLLIKYGNKQFKIHFFQKRTVPIIILLLVFFVAFFYEFAPGVYDTPIGATSAFFLSVGISTLYIVLLLSNKKVENFSFFSGLYRALGDTILTIFAIQYTGIGIIAVMGTYVIVLDFVYVFMLWDMKHKNKLKLR